jgi:hypothetical protein
MAVDAFAGGNECFYKFRALNRTGMAGTRDDFMLCIRKCLLGAFLNPT